MISINDLKLFLETGTGQKFYPLTFSLNAPNDCSIVLFDGGLPPQPGLSKVHFQVITRAAHPSTAEAMALQIKAFLQGKTDFVVGSAHGVLCSALNPAPLYIGQDENNRYKYSLNYQMMLEV